MNIYIHTHIYIYIYIYTHTYIHTHTHTHRLCIDYTATSTAIRKKSKREQQRAVHWGESNVNSWWIELSIDKSLICVSVCVCVCVCVCLHSLMSFVSCLLSDPWGQILACTGGCVCVCVCMHARMCAYAYSLHCSKQIRKRTLYGTPPSSHFSLVILLLSHLLAVQ